LNVIGINIDLLACENGLFGLKFKIKRGFKIKIKPNYEILLLLNFNY